VQDPERIGEARRTINRMKARFDDLGLTFDDRPLIAVIRPPLTKPSFGLAVGTIEPSGQVRFTFDRASAFRLKDQLVEQRAARPDVARAVHRTAFVYTVNKDHPSPPDICPELN